MTLTEIRENLEIDGISLEEKEKLFRKMAIASLKETSGYHFGKLDIDETKLLNNLYRLSNIVKLMNSIGCQLVKFKNTNVKILEKENSFFIEIKNNNIDTINSEIDIVVVKYVKKNKENYTVELEITPKNSSCRYRVELIIPKD